jgi:hypothetical protein
MKTPLLVGPLAKAVELPFALEVSSLARRYVRSHGGQVFLWHKRLGRSWIVESVSCEPPPGRRFTLYDTGEFTLCLERGYRIPERIGLARRTWPFARLSVTTSEDMGQQVDVFSNPPGTYGGP